MPSLSILLFICESQAKTTVSPPMGLYKIAAYASGDGIDCDVLCMDLDSPDKYLAKAEAGGYDVLGISPSHWNAKQDLEVLWRFHDRARKSGKPVLFVGGGQEASMNPGQWLHFGIDLIFLGFAEKTFAEFCRRYRDLSPDKRAGPVEDLAGELAGVSYLDRSGALRESPAETMTCDYFREVSHHRVLSMEIPFAKYWEAVRGAHADTSLGSEFIVEFVRLYTSSHCSRRCGFCNSQNFLPISQGGKSPIIMLGAEEVFELVQHFIDTYGARGFFFSDDDFPIGNRAGIDRAKRFSKLVVEAKRAGRIPETVRFHCQARIADFLVRGTDGTKRPDPAFLEVLEKAGFRSVAMGVETFSDRLLKAPSINKVGITAENCMAVLDAMTEAGMVPLINLIIGIPEAEPRELVETLDIALDYIIGGCEINVTGPMLALPGAPLLDDERYPVHHWHWTHPKTGEVHPISSYFEPFDPAVAAVSNGYDRMLDDALDEVARRHGWEGKILHKRIRNTTAILAAARLLEDAVLISKTEDVIARMVDRKSLVLT